MIKGSQTVSYAVEDVVGLGSVKSASGINSEAGILLANVEKLKNVL